jgi:hypothetical protein
VAEQKMPGRQPSASADCVLHDSIATFYAQAMSIRFNFQQIHIEVYGPGRCLPALLSGVTPPPRHHIHCNTALAHGALAMPLRRLRTYRIRVHLAIPRTSKICRRRHSFWPECVEP